MRMPGFNAEGALDRTNARYHTGRLYGAWTASQRVYPQLPKSIGFCMSGCDAQFEWGTVDNAYCKAQCFDDGNGGAEVETVEAVTAGVGISFAVHATSEPGSSAAYCPEKVQRGSAAA